MDLAQNVFIEKVKDFLHGKYPFSPPLAHVHSFGCQQNVSDGEKIMGLLSAMGYGFTDDLGKADLIIYNTCAVRETAETRVFGNLGELKPLKEKNPELVIGICGCMAQQEHVVEKIKNSYKHVDMVFGTFMLSSLPELLYSVLAQHKRVYSIEEKDVGTNEFPNIIRSSKIKAFVPVMYGCDNFCSYCIVPYVRGRERSRPVSSILKEVEELVQNGCKEITLLGQNVNSYGKGLDEKITFPELLRKLNEINGDFKLRFMSSHPKDAGFELIDAILECEKVGTHLHLPFQSGSNRILSQMNRKYTREDYLKIIDYARSKKADFSFSSDVIVGFPNETDDDFEETLNLIKRVEFDNLYTFIYSKRSGTKAAEMEDLIPYEAKAARMKRLLELQREIASNRYKTFIGRTLFVLAEAEGKKGDGYLTGHSDENIIVEFKAEKENIGRFVKVKITGAYNWALVGEIEN